MKQRVKKRKKSEMRLNKKKGRKETSKERGLGGGREQLEKCERWKRDKALQIKYDEKYLV